MPKVFLLVEKRLQDAWAKPLLTEGYEVIAPENFREAAESILSQPPDLLIVQYDLDPTLVYDLLVALKNNLYLSFLPIIMVLPPDCYQLDWELYPADDFVRDKVSVEELLSRVNLAFARAHRLADNNPLTGLPGNTSILKYIQEKLDKGEEVAIGYVDLDHFKPFNDRYGFARGDEILRALARILTNVVQNKAGDKGFVGHIGGDDFVFICPMELAEPIAREIIKNFERIVPSFLDEEDLTRGCFISQDRQGITRRFPLPSVSIGVVLNENGRFKHYGEVASIAAQLKKYVKNIPGSTFFIDRRKG